MTFTETPPTEPAPLPPDGMDPGDPRHPGGMPPSRPPLQPRAPRSGARNAWMVIGALLAVASVVWGAFQVVGLLAHGEYTETNRFDAAGVGSLSISSASGSVAVVGTDTDEIVVTADVSDGLRSTENRQEIVGDELQIESSCPIFGSQWCGVDYTVEAPADVALAISSNDGSVDVRGISGPIDINGDNGSIDVDDTQGTLRLSNDQGSITATRIASSIVEVDNDHGGIDLTFTQPPTAVNVENDHGSIVVAVPETPDAYAVSIDVNHGQTDELIRTDPNSDRAIDIDNDHGDVTVRYAE